MIDLNKIGAISSDWGKWIQTNEVKSIFKSFKKQYKEAFKLHQKWWKAGVSYQYCATQEERESVEKEITECKKEFSSVMMDILVKHLKICGATLGDIEKELKKKLAEKD